MKTLKFLGIAALTVCMGLNFSACDDDDDDEVKNEGGQVLPELSTKHLVAIHQTYHELDDDNSEYNDEDYIYFRYDEEGHLYQVAKVDMDHPRDTTNIELSWKENQISGIYDTETFSYNLINGMVNSYDEQEFGMETHWAYIYDKNNQLVSCGDIDEEEPYWLDLGWKNGKINTIEQAAMGADYVGGKMTFEYGQQCKGYFPLLYEFFSFTDDYFLWAHPELVGKLIKDLPTRMVIHDNDGCETLISFTHVKDGEGYVVRTELRSVFKDEVGDPWVQSTDCYDFTWE